MQPDPARSRPDALPILVDSLASDALNPSVSKLSIDAPISGTCHPAGAEGRAGSHSSREAARLPSGSSQLRSSSALGEVLGWEIVGSSQHRGFDHVTIAVTDLNGAKTFFALLGFEETAATVVSGEEMSAFMGIPGWIADHVTLTLRGVATHQEVQLLLSGFHHPQRPKNGDRIQSGPPGI